jgi:hypothetical protein
MSIEGRHHLTIGEAQEITGIATVAGMFGETREAPTAIGTVRQKPLQGGHRVAFRPHILARKGRRNGLVQRVQPAEPHQAHDLAQDENDRSHKRQHAETECQPSDPVLTFESR